MKIFVQEVKKILRPVPLLVLFLLMALYWYTFLTGNMTISLRTQVFIDLTELVGNKFSVNEIDKVKAAVLELEARYIAEFNLDVQGNQNYIDAGIFNYDDYMVLRSKQLYRDIDIEEWERYGRSLEEIHEIYSFYRNLPLFDPEIDYTLTPAEEHFYYSMVIWSTPSAVKLSDLESWVCNRIEHLAAMEPAELALYPGEYYYNESLRDWFGVPAAGIERIRDIYDSGEMFNILPESYHGFLFLNLIITVFGAVFILLAPVVTRDNMSGVRGMQYSSKTGRKTLFIQLAAMLFVAFVVTAVQVTVMFWFYARNVWFAFIETGLHSIFRSHAYNWFSGIYLHYIILVGLLFVIVSFAVALFLFIFSKISRNYITLLLSTIPIVIVLIALSINIFRDPFAVMTSDGFTFYRMFPIPFVEVYICIAMLLLAAIPAGLVADKATAGGGVGSNAKVDKLVPLTNIQNMRRMRR